MARRFRGSETFKVDAKGRVSIPASFRRVIEAGDPEVFTMEAIYEIDEQIDAMQRGSVARAEIEELMYAQSHQTDIDGDGRLVLPQKLREKIGLKAEAFFASAGTSFKIWDPEAYEAEQSALASERATERPERYDPLVNLPKIGGA